MLDFPGECKRVMWGDIFMFLLQEGIVASLSKHLDTHRERVNNHDKGLHADLL